MSITVAKLAGNTDPSHPGATVRLQAKRQPGVSKGCLRAWSAWRRAPWHTIERATTRRSGAMCIWRR